MIRSTTFVVGILLAIGAFLALVLLGTLFNPPPHQIVIARGDIPAFTTLSPDVLVTDAQTMNADVAAQLVTREELKSYLGSFTVETIHAGEPLRKSALVSAQQSNVSRLALMLDNPDSVAMVIPVDPKTAPEQIQVGDRVDIVLSLTPGAINANAQENFGNARPTSIASNAIPVPTRVLTATLALSTTVLTPEEMNLPVTKVTIRQVPVLAVRRERIANPNFSVSPGIGEAEATQPAYIEGDLQAVLVRVPRASAELLTFAMDNGKVHLSLLSPLVVENQQDAPTLGIAWNDVMAWMMAERQHAAGNVVVVNSSTPTTTITATISRTPTPRIREFATPTTTASAIPNSFTAPGLAMPQISADWLGNLACIALPLGIGSLLVVGAFVILRRFKKD